jgi:hypothetical protein
LGTAALWGQILKDKQSIKDNYDESQFYGEKLNREILTLDAQKHLTPMYW